MSSDTGEIPRFIEEQTRLRSEFNVAKYNDEFDVTWDIMRASQQDSVFVPYGVPGVESYGGHTVCAEEVDESRVITRHEYWSRGAGLMTVVTTTFRRGEQPTRLHRIYTYDGTTFGKELRGRKLSEKERQIYGKPYRLDGIDSRRGNTAIGCTMESLTPTWEAYRQRVEAATTDRLAAMAMAAPLN